MATLAARGSGTPATTGTTWATVTNAVDGAAGTNPATYATMTNATASAVATIEVTGYNFSSTIGASDTLNSVTVNLRHFENNTGRFTSVRFQPYDGATAIGSIFTATMATAARNDSTTFPVTLAQLRSSTFKIRVTITGAASTQSRVESIDYVDVTADYTPLPPAITQAAYRFYADGTETGATALAAQDTAPTVDTSGGDVNLQVRVRLQSTNAVDVGASDDFQLQWEKNTSGTWSDVVGTPTEILADSYPLVNRDSAWSMQTTLFLGQSFMGNGQELTRVGFALRKVGSPTVDLTAELHSHTGTFGTTSAPNLFRKSSAPVAGSTLTTSFAMVYFTFSGTPFKLTNATPWMIGLQPGSSGVLDASNYFEFGYDVSGTHSGNFYRSAAPVSWDGIFELYTAPTVSTAVPYASANLTDAAATTNRLGAGSGSFIAGKVSEDGLVDDLGWAAISYTELLYSVTLKQADLTPTDTLQFRVLRNGATTGLTYTQTPTVTIGTAGPTDRTGTASGSITLSGASSGQKEVTGAAAGSLTVTGAAAGVISHDVLGTATGTLTLVGTAAGSAAAAPVLGTATGSLTVTGTASGLKTVTATAAGQLTLSGTSAGVRPMSGVATGTVTVTGTTAGQKTVTATGTGSLTLSSVAVGTVTVTGTAAGSLTVTGTATGLHVVAATATGALTLTGTANAQKTVGGTASSTITVTGTATAQKMATGTATGQITFASTALGLVEGNAVGTGGGSLTISGAATGVRGRPGVATGTLALTGVATGMKSVTAAATATITITSLATGFGSGVVTTIIGEWNDQEVTGLQWGELAVVDWFMLVPTAVTGTGTGSLSFTGVAVGTSGKVGVAVGTVTLSGTAAGVVTTAGTDVLMEPFNNLTDAPWTTAGGSPSISAARHGTGVSLAGTLARIRYSIPAGPGQDATLTIGFAYHLSSLAANRHPVSLLSDTAGTSHVALRVTTTGAVAVLRGGAGGTVLGTSAASGLVVATTWVYIELQTKLGDTGVGTFEVRVNGSTVLGPTVADTKFSGVKTVFDAVELLAPGSGVTHFYDDLYITAGAGAPFKGDITI